MDSFLFTLASFLVALAILITVHEFGHFWVARRLGVKVLRFSIGFGRPLWKRVSPRDGTEYVVASLPLGGYVKMLDESEGEVAEADLPRAFNRQKLWKRAAIVAAGPLFNFMFAILAYWLVFVSGDVGLRPLIGDVEPESIAESAGFRPGDELLAIDGRETATWEAALYALMGQYLQGKDLQVTVRGDDGSERVRWLDGDALGRLPDDPDILGSIGLSPRRPSLPPVLGEVVDGDPAQRAGLRPGDRLLNADGQRLESWRDWVEYVRERPGQHIRLQIERDGATLDLDLTPKSIELGEETVGRIGAGVQVPEGLQEQYRRVLKLGPLDALNASLSKTWDLSVLMLKVLGRMLTGQASVENLSGPISIAETAGKSASYGFTHFMKFLAVVSISLGVLNLLPIPVLDGGHLMFFLVEAVKGSPLSEQAMLQGQRIGLALLLALMTLAFYVDINRLLG
jgi:regulator of sigma E protease